MGFHPELSAELIDFIKVQPMFFTGTAAETGRVNVSPKGCDTFRVIDSKTVAYLDFTGSGNETAAHVLRTKRMTIMFCSFGAKPLILRLYGTGEIVRPDHPKWNQLLPRFQQYAGQRQIIVLNVESVQTSCGMAVPRMMMQEHRMDLVDWAANKGEKGIEEYQQKKNRISIDGLPTSVT